MNKNSNPSLPIFGACIFFALAFTSLANSNSIGWAFLAAGIVLSLYFVAVVANKKPARRKPRRRL